MWVGRRHRNDIQVDIRGKFGKRGSDHVFKDIKSSVNLEWSSMSHGGQQVHGMRSHTPVRNPRKNSIRDSCLSVHFPNSSSSSQEVLPLCHQTSCQSVGEYSLVHVTPCQGSATCPIHSPACLEAGQSYLQGHPYL
jgi:hypothetical protein